MQADQLCAIVGADENPRACTRGQQSGPRQGNRVGFVLILMLLVGCESAKSTNNVSKSADSQPNGKTQPTSEIQKQRILMTRMKLGSIDNMMSFFATLDNDDVYPVASGQQLLEALTKKHDLQGDGYFADPVFENPDDHKDAWGNPIHYEWPNTKIKGAKRPALWSYGPNGINEHGAGDDLRNW